MLRPTRALDREREQKVRQRVFCSSRKENADSEEGDRGEFLLGEAVIVVGDEDDNPPRTKEGEVNKEEVTIEVEQGQLKKVFY